MRPVPSAKHTLAITIFLLVAGLLTFLSWHDERLSDEQTSLACATAKRHQPGLLPYDTVFGEVNADGRLAKLPSPVFLALMDAVLIPTGYRDLVLPFRILLGPMVLVYLCGMYALLWRQCRSCSIAAFVAVLSSTITPTFAGWFWGVGSLASITPQGLVLACSPLVLWAYISFTGYKQVLLTFATLGLLANIDLVSAGNLAIILLLTHLARNAFRLRAILGCLGGAGCFVAGALPYILYFIALRQGVAAGFDSEAQASGSIRALRVSGLALLYPEMFHDLLPWGLYAATLLLLSGVVLWRFHRFGARNMDVWLWMAALALLVALGLSGASQLVGAMLHQPPWIIDFPQAAAWVMLPLYVLFAQALTHVFRMVRNSRGYLRWLCAAMMVAWMLPSHNLRPLRHWLYSAASITMDEAHKPARVQELAERKRKADELKALAGWARGNTDLRAMFLTDSGTFRMLARRSIYACSDDVRPFYYLAPQLLPKWTGQVLAQYRWLGGPIDESAIVNDVDKLTKTHPFRDVPEWYVLLPTRPGLGNLRQLRPVTSQAWGRYWQVYQVPARANLDERIQNSP